MIALCTLLGAAGPTLVKLIRLKLAEKIGVRYTEFGVVLLDDIDGSKITAIEREFGRNSSDINCHIFQLWLQGKGKQPVTWATLIAVLRDIEMNQLAKSIEESLRA